MTRRASPERLARELLGRELENLEPEEQAVIQRVASGTYTGMDAAEVAQARQTVGDRLADRVAAVGGSWGFIVAFGIVLLAWMMLNGGALQKMGLEPFDAYPYIFLNLILSMLAAIQAPIIMMSQNRQSAKDRIAARHDYEVNLRTQLEIVRLSRRIDRFTHLILYSVRGNAEPGQDPHLEEEIEKLLRKLRD